MPRPVFALPALALAVLAWTSAGPLHRLTAVVAVVDALLFFIPWRLPRRDWGAAKFWLESLLYLVPTTVLLVVAAATGAPWVAELGDPRWLLVGAAAGCGLVLASGIDVRGLVSGDLAFLAGPDRPSHSEARAAHGAVGAVIEEVFFRGACFALAAPTPLVVLATSVAFVSRHRLLKGVPRWRPSTIAVEVLAAGVFSALVLVSGSLYAAVVAHFVANAPYATLELQRARQSRRELRHADEAGHLA